jgi:ribosome-binding factor A
MRSTASYRMRRVNEALKEIIGLAITEDLKDPRIGFVTLTGVDAAPDLSHAKVFVSVYGKRAEKQATMEGLRSAEAFLQRRINEELRLKRTPSLEFVYDETVDRGMRIQVLLKASGADKLPPEEADEAADRGADDAALGAENGERDDEADAGSRSDGR